MLFDYRKILTSDAEMLKIEASLDEYLALEGDALSRMRFKRKGPARRMMVEALAQMAMLFASANMGSEIDFEACLGDVLVLASEDDAARRALRAFYLRNVSRVPGTMDDAIGRLSLARPRIMDVPVVPGAPEV